MPTKVGVSFPADREPMWCWWAKRQPWCWVRAQRGWRQRQINKFPFVLPHALFDRLTEGSLGTRGALPSREYASRVMAEKALLHATERTDLTLC